VGIGHIGFAIEPAPDDLRPFLNGLSPERPGRDYFASQRAGAPTRPWPPDWDRFHRYGGK